MCIKVMLSDVDRFLPSYIDIFGMDCICVVTQMQENEASSEPTCEQDLQYMHHLWSQMGALLWADLSKVYSRHLVWLLHRSPFLPTTATFLQQLIWPYTMGSHCRGSTVYAESSLRRLCVDKLSTSLEMVQNVNYRQKWKDSTSFSPKIYTF